MRKLLLSALLLASSSGLSGSVPAQEPVAQPVQTASRSVPLGEEAPSLARKAGPYSAADAEAVANELVRRGFVFIRYDRDAAGWYWVVYTR